VMPVGASMVTVSTAEVPRALAPNLAMYVRGTASVTNEGEAMADRVPGLFTGERPSHPAGTTVVTATEETEFWCFNYTANRKALPVLTPVRLAAGDVLALSAGTLLFVLLGSAGDVVGPCQYVPEADLTLTADTDLYGFIFEAVR
jgi:hypothetical protein